ncbi:MAG: hypothetical protein AAGI23_08390 [Bacteroidota bacterium]
MFLGIYSYCSALFVLFFAILNQVAVNEDKFLKIRVVDLYKGTVFTDSLSFQYGTILSKCNTVESRVWLLPNEDGFYSVESSCSGFILSTKRDDYIEIEYEGLQHFDSKKILIDSVPIFPYQGYDTTYTVTETRKKIGLFRKDIIHQETEITKVGYRGFNEDAMPQEISFKINKKSKHFL